MPVYKLNKRLTTVFLVSILRVKITGPMMFLSQLNYKWVKVGDDLIDIMNNNLI